MREVSAAAPRPVCATAEKPAKQPPFFIFAGLKFAGVFGSMGTTLNMKKRIQSATQRKAGKAGKVQPALESGPRWSLGWAYALFFLAYCVVIVLWAEPRVQHFGRPRAFYFDEGFFRSFLIRPGGLVEYMARGLQQCYQFTWLGAGITTALAGLLALGSWLLLGKLKPGPAGTLCLWPAVGLLAVQQQYAFPWLETGLGLLGAVWLAVAYAWVPVKRPWLRWLVFLGMSWPTYAVLAGAYLVFALYCGLVEVLAWRRYWLALALLGLAALVPAVGSWYFSVHLSDAYHLLLPSGLKDFPIVMAALPYAALPLAGLAKAGRFFLYSAPEKPPTKGKTRPRFNWRRMIEPALLALLAVGVVGWGWNPIHQRRARIKCLSQDRKWDGVLAEARLLPVYDPSMIAHINRALCETGRLPYEMFAYPQKPDYAFWLSANYSEDGWSMVPCEELFELGQINRAERIGGEALEMNGYLPDVLKRLADVNVLKGEPQTARIFLNILAKTPFQGAWARQRLRALDADPRLPNDPEIQRVRALQVAGDYPFEATTEDILLQCLRQNQTNRAAFEYLMAYYLLTLNPDSFVHYFRAARNFNYPEIPTHYEEALVLAQRLKGAPLAIPDINGKQPRAETIQRFERFNEQVALRGNDLQRAKIELAAEFGSTYWYYFTFGASGAAATRTDLFAKKP